MASIYANLEHFYLIQFWIFLLLIIPAMISLCFGLYNFFRDKNLRQSLHNHIIIVVLIINAFYQLTDMIYFIHYFRCFETFSATPAFHLIFGYIDWAVFTLQYILYAWITAERHILIFHNQLLSTSRNRLLFHYIPPILLTIYCLLYYAIIFFASKCTYNFENMLAPNYMPCAFANNALKTYEIIAHTILPTFIIVFSSIALLLRVFWQKYRMKQQFQWRRYRIMTMQVLPISCVFLIFPFPYVIVVLLQLCGLSASIGGAFLSIARFSSYYALLIFPIIAVGSSAELRQKFKKILLFGRQERAIAPTMTFNQQMM
ncbi:unnamed protein product [Rotaria socialis]|uniref:G-protein coupled receptors family 1 profile domain-containing protein n=3 Tax=Rotaria socialis TaxID=392032 RepID=A0A821VCC5_9BILA|nr:unnamed protein product [Rotaria socialis]